MIQHGKSRAVELRRQEPFRNGHSNTHSKSLPERAGSAFNPRREVVFRMAWGLAPPLAKPSYFVQGYVVTCQMQ
jgi:hypothetical protein